MKYNITIGAPLAKRQNVETFKIEIRFMHGDADAYTTETCYVKFTDTQRLNAFVSSLEFVTSKAFPDASYQDKQIAALREFCARECPDHAAELEDILFLNDCTDMGFNSFAAVTGYAISYFDSQSIEREVEVQGEQHVQ